MIAITTKSSISVKARRILLHYMAFFESEVSKMQQFV